MKSSLIILFLSLSSITHTAIAANTCMDLFGKQNDMTSSGPSPFSILRAGAFIDLKPGQILPYSKSLSFRVAWPEPVSVDLVYASTPSTTFKIVNEEGTKIKKVGFTTSKDELIIVDENNNIFIADFLTVKTTGNFLIAKRVNSIPLPAPGFTAVGKNFDRSKYSEYGGSYSNGFGIINPEKFYDVVLITEKVHLAILGSGYHILENFWGDKSVMATQISVSGVIIAYKSSPREGKVWLQTSSNQFTEIQVTGYDPEAGPIATEVLIQGQP